MITLGIKQTLLVAEDSPFGLYLKENLEDEEKVLLPNKEVPDDFQLEDELEVFIYRDSEDRLTATLEEPALQVGEVGRLRVIDVTKVGAFLAWGLDKDLLLPFGEQKGTVRKNDEVVVLLYVDNSDRLSATMNVYTNLASSGPFEEGDQCDGILYSFSDLGAFVAVEGKYHGMIHNNELYGYYQPGDTVSVRIKKVREDGKLELSLRKPAHEQIDDDAHKIMKRIQSRDGYLPLNDHSEPKRIQAELQMSKRAFKRAVGRLLKENLIEITEKGIALKAPETENEA